MTNLFLQCLSLDTKIPGWTHQGCTWHAFAPCRNLCFNYKRFTYSCLVNKMQKSIRFRLSADIPWGNFLYNTYYCKLNLIAHHWLPYFGPPSCPRLSSHPLTHGWPGFARVSGAARFRFSVTLDRTAANTWMDGWMDGWINLIAQSPVRYPWDKKMNEEENVFRVEVLYRVSVHRLWWLLLTCQPLP